ncbi:YitT family protein [Clostridium grantii]|uniref:Uncharacterized membrane-anchored protein YitT, contains DUF161 and DUF2179 domains n=1 Tax=Clostridium grantii DSM 8605 TaxID=1121316 RepID=A0A1M5RJU5_9CLOT|nr:YitT family protein [Clostridium grantii]SHH26368.1 Uncharacterized membrane-anchored protein YitT, contains DUF161 and DUF2179 domains [Clostridium grantii DSM 8605]
MKNFMKDLFFIVVGCIFYSIYLSMIVIPNGLATGGLAGISISLNHLFGTKIGVALILMNIPLFIFGFKLVGKSFALKSAIIVFISSFLVDLTNNYFSFNALDEKLLAAIFAGVVSGVAMSLIFIGGASTGGMDISGKIIKNKMPTVDLAKILLIQDVIVYLLIGTVLGVNSVMYAVIMSFVKTKTIDAIQEGLASSRQCIIISDSPEEIIHQIQVKLGRGVTLLNAEGTYTSKSKNFIYVVIQKNQLSPLKKIVDSIDPKAFVTVTAVSNVLGNFKQTSYSVQ